MYPTLASRRVIIIRVVTSQLSCVGMVRHGKVKLTDSESDVTIVIESVTHVKRRLSNHVYI